MRKLLFLYKVLSFIQSEKKLEHDLVPGERDLAKHFISYLESMECFPLTLSDLGLQVASSIIQMMTLVHENTLDLGSHRIIES